MAEQKLYIHGGYVDATSGEAFETVNPANSEVICSVQIANALDVDKAVSSARQGFEIWSQKTGTQRSRILMQAVSLLRERNRELAELEVMDNGKPIQEAEVVDVSSGADCIEYFAGLAPTIGGQHIQLENAFGYTRREPLGVCVGIGAWNYPLQIACWINNYNITPIELPIGGYKQSGLGRENSPAAIDHYTQLKSVYVELGDVDCPYE